MPYQLPRPRRPMPSPFFSGTPVLPAPGAPQLQPELVPRPTSQQELEYLRPLFQEYGQQMVPTPPPVSPFRAALGAQVDLSGTTGWGSFARGLSGGLGAIMQARAERQREMTGLPGRQLQAGMAGYASLQQLLRGERGEERAQAEERRTMLAAPGARELTEAQAEYARRRAAAEGLPEAPKPVGGLVYGEAPQGGRTLGYATTGPGFVQVPVPPQFGEPTPAGGIVTPRSEQQASLAQQRLSLQQQNLALRQQALELQRTQAGLNRETRAERQLKMAFQLSQNNKSIEKSNKLLTFDYTPVEQITESDILGAAGTLFGFSEENMREWRRALRGETKPAEAPPLPDDDAALIDQIIYGK